MKAIGTFLGIVALVALALFGYQKYGEWQDARLEKWRTDSTRVADSTAARVSRSAKTDTVYRTITTGYRGSRATALTSPTATTRDTALFAMCDAVVSACDQRHAADSSEKAALRDELRVARARPVEKPKRLVLYGAGLYDLLNGAPVFQAGVELRLLGGIHATAIGDLAIPPMGEARVQTRGLVGIRYVF